MFIPTNLGTIANCTYLDIHRLELVCKKNGRQEYFKVFMKMVPTKRQHDAFKNLEIPTIYTPSDEFFESMHKLVDNLNRLQFNIIKQNLIALVAKELEKYGIKDSKEHADYIAKCTLQNVAVYEAAKKKFMKINSMKQG